VNGTICITGLDRSQATELLESCGLKVDHRSGHRGYWTGSVIFAGEDKIGRMLPPSHNFPLTTELMVIGLNDDELSRIIARIKSG
jgi:hypothetical protein